MNRLTGLTEAVLLLFCVCVVSTVAKDGMVQNQSNP